MTLAPQGGATFPAVPFVLTVYPTGTGPLFTNAENVLVTAMAGNAVTAMTRGAQGTNARAIIVGDQAANTITQTDLEAFEDSISDRLISSMSYFGTATLNDIFGYFKAAAATTISRIQIAAQTVPAGSAINVTLVDAAGVSLGSIGVLADTAAFQETVLGAPLVLAPGDEVRAKLTLVDGTGGYLVVNLL